MSNSALIVELRKKAIDILRESTEMFEQGLRQRRDGNLEQATKAEEVARSKRIESAWLMNEANRLEKEAESLLALRVKIGRLFIPQVTNRRVTHSQFGSDDVANDGLREFADQFFDGFARLPLRRASIIRQRLPTSFIHLPSFRSRIAAAH